MLITDESLPVSQLLGARAPKVYAYVLCYLVNYLRVCSSRGVTLLNFEPGGQRFESPP